MRRHLIRGLVLAVLAGIGALAGALVPASSAKATSAHASKSTITVNVVATEWAFKLSKRSVPVGSTVAFKVTNKGKIGHDFQIAGKKTKLLAPGKSQLLTVKFGKKGTFTYVCTVTGHARLGMQGKLGVGVKAPAGGGTSTTTPTTPTTTGNVGNAETTVTVNMIEYAFQLSQSSIPSGKVTFVIKNSGADVHNFDINGVKSGAIIAPGATDTWTVSPAPGQYLYTCDVPFHVGRGMTGALTITP